MNTLNDELMRAFPESGMSRGSTVYFPVISAQGVIRYSREHGILILGMEGVRLRDGELQPDLNFIADFSSLVNRGDRTLVDVTADAATSILSHWMKEPDLAVTFALARS